MELSFTEYGVLDKQNRDNGGNVDYKTYYDDLIQQPLTNMQTSNNIYKAENSATASEIKSSVRYNAPLTKNIEKQKKRISYDDILSSMNTVVINGKLEFISKDKMNNIIENERPNTGSFKKKVSFNDPQQPMQQVNKNSYIYNKFFKDYKDPRQNQYEDEVPQRPLTKKELINQIIINRIKDVNERNRIAEVKSTKLLFNNNNMRNIVINPTQNQASLNRLFRFK